MKINVMARTVENMYTVLDAKVVQDRFKEVTTELLSWVPEANNKQVWVLGRLRCAIQGMVREAEMELERDNIIVTPARLYQLRDEEAQLYKLAILVAASLNAQVDIMASRNSDGDWEFFIDTTLDYTRGPALSFYLDEYAMDEFIRDYMGC